MQRSAFNAVRECQIVLLSDNVIVLDEMFALTRWSTWIARSITGHT